MRFVMMMAALAVLAGCETERGSVLWLDTATTAEKQAYFTEKCARYGFKAGTVEMAQCLQKETVHGDQQVRALWSDIHANTPRTTNCTQFSTMTSCTTY